MNLTKEHKRKIGEANSPIMKKKWQDPEYRKHMSESHKGNFIKSMGQKIIQKNN